ncbi:hypothetical protein [Mucilaginibacter humi]|uniref:hypothetical protein n=1 Tax=Mucilaginibacter humi TaxID=2732510 RepID=UPI001C2E2A52|nr:hypothetical protein [Mucilaginibacter humi]
MKIQSILLPMLFVAAGASAQNKDWPNIHRYEQANTEAPAPQKGEKRVVYMGDSITDFWIGNDGDFLKTIIIMIAV